MYTLLVYRPMCSKSEVGRGRRGLADVYPHPSRESFKSSIATVFPIQYASPYAYYGRVFRLHGEGLLVSYFGLPVYRKFPLCISYSYVSV